MRADRRGVQVVLDQREARRELRQAGLKLGQGGVGQKGNPSRQLLELVEPGVLEQLLLLLVLVDPEAGLLVQVEIGRLVVVLRLLERPVDDLAEIGSASKLRVEQFRPPGATDGFHLVSPRVLRRQDGGGGRQVAGHRREFLHQVVQLLDLLHEVEVRLLGLDLRDASGRSS